MGGRLGCVSYTELPLEPLQGCEFALFLIAVEMPRVKAAQAGRQGPAKRRLAEQFAAGEVMTDLSKKEWKLGLPIGQGGFGCIYLGEYVATPLVLVELHAFLPTWLAPLQAASGDLW